MRTGASPLAYLALWEGAWAMAAFPVSPSHPLSRIPRGKGKRPPFPMWVGTARKDDFIESKNPRGHGFLRLWQEVP